MKILQMMSKDVDCRFSNINKNKHQSSCRVHHQHHQKSVNYSSNICPNSSNMNLIPSSRMLIITIIITLIPFPYLYNCELLHGTTILNWPYVSQKPNGQFEGFCIDLLNELAPLMGMVYTLSVVPDGQYGGWVSSNGSINGMIGQVVRGDYDFAIGDLTVLSNRARFVDFTLGFLDYGLAALVHRDTMARLPKGQEIRTFKDLSEQTTVRYGVKKHGANLPLFHDSPVVAKMYSFMDTHPSVFVEGEREGLQRVKQELNYAFITESPFVEYVVQRDCDLLMIDDRRRNFQFEYAIAVPKGSPLKERFNKAIRQLRNEGRIRDLKDKYWHNPYRNCPDDPDFNPARAESTSGIRFSDRDTGGTNADRLRPTSTISGSDRLRTTTTTTSESDKLRIGGGGGRRVQFDDRVDEEDIEFVRPRPDQRTRPRRPINRKFGGNNSVKNLPENCILITFLIIIAHLLMINQ